MAIKNGLNRRLAEIGKIKIGGKGKETKSKKNDDGSGGKKFRMPVKWDHFKVTTTERDKDGNFVPDPDVMGTEGVGEKPKELSIRLPFDNIDMNFHTSYQLYAGAKLKCKGDGENAERKDKDGKVSIVACAAGDCEYMQEGIKTPCKVSGILSCYLVASPSYGGVYRFRTHSWNSVSNILAALEEFARNTNGILQGLPLKLKMLKKATEEHGNVNTVTIVLDGIEIAKMRELAIQESKSRQSLNVDMKAIEHAAVEQGFNEDTDDPEEIEAEFYETGEDIDDSAGASADDVQSEIEAKDDTAEPEGGDDGSGKDLF